ncbi:MAG TPA: GatB/YqeY domain-containing protein [Clostridia bacterium]|nr:GatB/YqeY domain-containing protein [Clostridia bacterium]
MLKEKLMDDLKQAMKEKNVNRKNVVQMVRAAVLQIEKDKHIVLEDNQVLEVISKEFKKRSDSLADYEKAGRQDIVDQIKDEMSVLEEYLPKKLSEDELKKVIDEIISETGASSIKDMGNIMKIAKERLGVNADGKMINEILKKAFN